MKLIAALVLVSLATGLADRRALRITAEFKARMMQTTKPGFQCAYGTAAGTPTCAGAKW